MDNFPAEAQKVAVAAAKEAGKIILNYYEANMKVSTKQGNPRNLVTAADKEADALIIREAGGTVTDPDGREWEPESKGVIAASSAKIAEQLLAKVKDAL
ncbi:hypothetical protein HYU40_03080 [Candidatus Woesearchaeota archaeon]|nr:hypothetical protein [Candidatus Woesearchaeota archaeon]